jgi:hypothetical protein
MFTIDAPEVYSVYWVLSFDGYNTTVVQAYFIFLFFLFFFFLINSVLMETHTTPHCLCRTLRDVPMTGRKIRPIGQRLRESMNEHK